jgi:CubicO group peptidase (beta-lactamase class C family)
MISRLGCRTLALPLLITTLFAVGSRGQVASSRRLTDPLIGMWSNVTRFNDASPRELVISHQGSTWRARVSGLSSTGSGEGSLQFTFPGKGSFRGWLDNRDNVINGFWIEPSGTIARLQNPYDQRFASRVVLRSIGKGRWKGVVEPLEQLITVYLKIFPTNDGKLLAAFRNPEANMVGGSMQYRVSREGNSIVFSAGPDPANPSIRFIGRMSQDRLKIEWQDLSGTIDFERPSPNETTAFFPRPPGSQKYVYRVPESLNDGWHTARAGDVGLDEDLLARAVQRIVDMDPSTNRPWMIHSMAIAYRGKLVLDEYFYGHSRDKPHDTRSASKVLSSVILGTLMKDNVDISPATKVYDVMAPRGPFSNADVRKSRITLGHLLTHSAGLACDDNSGSSPGDEVAVQADKTRPDWAKVTLDLPMAHEPGTRFAYCSMNTNLAGATLGQKTGEWLPALFDRQIARPLQFGPYHWNLMGNDEGYLGGGVWIRTRDFLKIGQTYLGQGVWNGRRIVSAEWIKESFTPHMRISPETTGLDPATFGNFYGEGHEGWAWHDLVVKSGNAVFKGYHSNGNGGQLLVVIPELDLTVMFTGGNYRQPLWLYERDRILGEMIIPAIRQSGNPPIPRSGDR